METDTDTDPPASLTLQTAFGSEDTLNVETSSIFAVWWDPAFDHSDDLPTLFGWLEDIRRDCLDNLGMADPPNPAAGHYYNVYIHHGADDSLPAGWGNGQGTDPYGLPFLTLPDGAHLSYGNILHEGFHIFQYEATSPGFAYAGDSQWYVESAAQWYQSVHAPDDLLTFVEAGAIVENPHLALWHSFSNHAPGDPTDWLYQVRQYGMHTYLHFLTEERGVAPDIISGGFYAGTDQLPQAYHFDRVGADPLRAYFADWAAHNTGGLDYLSPDQVERAWIEVELVGDPDNRHPTVLQLADAGVSGFRPDPAYAPRGWAYNVVEISITEPADYAIAFQGDEMGSEGAASHFEGRIVILDTSGARYAEVDMSGPLTGAAEVSTVAGDTALYLVFASVPEHFTGNQTYGYTLDVTRQ